MSKKRRAIPVNQARQDAELQKHIQAIQWAKDPKRAAAQLRKLAKELETDIDVRDLEFEIGKKYKSQDVRDSREWFKSEIINLLKDPFKIDKKNISKYTRGQKAISVPHVEDIGKMFTYRYDPKTKDILPYYDIFPLILMVKPLKDGFFGLNLHYLPPKQREILIVRLMEHMKNSRVDNRTRIKLNYDLLKHTAKYRYFKPSFKRYLYSHIKTTVKPIPFRFWPQAILMPTARFKKASISEVWADSLRSARGV